MTINKITYEEQAVILLERIALTAKKTRLSRKLSQQEAGFAAGVSIKIVQAVESAKNCQSLNLMTYLAYLDILGLFTATLPDPNRLTPVEQKIRSEKIVTEIKNARVSRDRPSTQQQINKVASKSLPWKE
jgi:transcriptional regulator with XRE-family HTH domain